MTAPERIYLQWIEDESVQYIHEGVTWCADKIEDDDVEYVRADIAARATAEQSDTKPSTEQDWAKLDGAVAFHLIERHAEDWADAGAMMDAWSKAKSQQDAAIEAKPAEQSADAQDATGTRPSTIYEYVRAKYHGGTSNEQAIDLPVRRLHGLISKASFSSNTDKQAVLDGLKEIGARMPSNPDLLQRITVELAALIPDPANPSVDAWPCQNPADQECLHKAFLLASSADHGSDAEDAKRWRYLASHIEGMRDSAELSIGRIAVLYRLDKYVLADIENGEVLAANIDAAIDAQRSGDGS